jgi:tetratricopeptide (TPR) repeat protein
MSFSSESFYAAVRATPQLVNREPILNEIKRAVDDPAQSVYVFYVTGDGGIGKTFLLREVLRRFREEKGWFSERIFAAQDVVDLYHTQTHTIEGLSHAIRRVLRPGLGYFADFERQRERLEWFKQDQEMLRDLTWQRERMARAFREDLGRLTDDYRLVLAIDTAEALQYEMDPIQPLLGLAAEGIAVSPWLLDDLLPQLKNAVILIAGRPYPKQLRSDLRAALGERLIERSLGPLDEKDSLIYFDLVAEAARQKGDPTEMEIASRIEAIPTETRRVIHHYTGGRPILLSLVLDYLVIADRLLPVLGDSMTEARSKSSDEIKDIQAQLEADIVRAMQETGRPAGEAIRVLGWTRRGLSSTMLAQIAGVDKDEADRMLDSLKHLSFIKVRPDDNRVFLQDEMYRLLQQHVLDYLPPPRATHVYETIVRYYEKEREQAQLALARLQADPGRDVEELIRAKRRLQNAVVERIHYYLRKDPLEGFIAYSRAAEAAFRASHEEIDMQLRTELLRYLAEAPPEARAIIEDRATWDTGVRWVKRNIVKSRYDEAIRLAKDLRNRASDLMGRLAPLAEAELDVWDGWARTYAGQDLDWVETAQRRAIGVFKKSTSEESRETLYLLASAYNNLGYLLRHQGRFPEAIDVYRQALLCWRTVKFETEQANTLNNLSWVLAEVGQFDRATLLCQDALDLRRVRGPRNPIALSINTMAMIQIRADQPHRAVQMARQSLRIFSELEQPRGIGLARRALSEALRRTSRVPELYSPEEQLELLKEAEEHADRAVEIFTADVPEPSRLVESLIELGCIFRDWVHLQVTHQLSSARSISDLAERSRKSLRRAAEEAHDLYLHLELDALVNLAWLHFCVDEFDRARKVVDEAFGLVVDDYFFSPKRGAPQVQSPTTFIWVQIGKAYLLLGAMHKDTFNKAYTRLREGGESTEKALELTQEHLVNAIQDLTLALAYDALYAPDFRDVRGAKRSIYGELKNLNPLELDLVHKTIKEVEDQYQMPHPSPLWRFLDEYFGLGVGREG